MSFPSYSDLSDHTGLVPWLEKDSWCDSFTPTVRFQGAKSKVHSIRLAKEPCEFDPKNLDLVADARVGGAGSRLFHTKVYLIDRYDRSKRSVTYDWESVCTCHEVVMCPHAFAVLDSLNAIATRRPKVLPFKLNLELSNWLRRVREVASEAPRNAPPPPKPYNKFLAYCIEIGPSGYRNDLEMVQFCTRIGNQNKTGVSIGQSRASADPSKPTKYMVDEDLPICCKIHQRSRNLGAWAGSELGVGDWDGILNPALATGRLFFSSKDDHDAGWVDYRPLREGPSHPVEVSWELMAGGDARPVLNMPSPSMRFIPTEPPRYLDAESLEIGLLLSRHPIALLRAWSEGPVISAPNVAELSQELVRINPDAPLPLPAERPPRLLQGLSPTPHLHISNVLVGIYQKRHVGAFLKFQYPGSQCLFPLGKNDPPVTSWFEGDTRVILDRDSEAESAFAASLKDHGFTPLHELIAGNELNDKNRHSVVIRHPTTRVTDWLEFLNSRECKALLDKGWTIETDPKLNLVIHDVHDFFPEIETDAAHGIDWFRFDVTGEFDGRKISLIPQIARAIAEDWHLRYPDPDDIPETLLLACDKPSDGHVRFPARRFLEMIGQVRHLFLDSSGDGGPILLDRLGAAGLADALEIDSSETTRALAALGRNLRDVQGLPPAAVPATIRAELRHYQLDGFRWLQFLAQHGLHGILADDMGLGKTLQTLAHLAAEAAKTPGTPSMVVAPTSVVPNWAAEAAKFAPDLKILVLHGGDRSQNYENIPAADVVLTSYPLLVRDFDELARYPWHVLVLDEAQYIKNPKSISAYSACKLRAAHRICLSGTPMENHLGELWSLMRFLMPGFLSDEKTFNNRIRKPIERDRHSIAQIALNRRVSPLILRRTKDQVATELPEKTTLIHGIDLNPQQTDLYESVRAAMDERVRKAITDKGLAKSHIIVLDALLKLRQICCHPQLLKSEAAQRVRESAKLEYLTQELLPTLMEEGRRMLIFSQFTSMLALIEEHLNLEQIPYLKLTGQTKERANLVKQFQTGKIPVFLISLKAGGTGLNLTAADTVIHYDPWWNPAAENQATDRAHRIGQTKSVFVHKLVCRGTIEDRILDLQKRKASLVEALLSEETSKLNIDEATLSHLLSPMSGA
jgi:SNF2-related domain/Helicase conserved C-terminal domain